MYVAEPLAPRRPRTPELTPSVAPLSDADMIALNNPILTQHISIPKDMSSLSCEAFTAGVVEGVLDGLDFVRRPLSTLHLLAFNYPLLTCICPILFLLFRSPPR